MNRPSPSGSHPPRRAWRAGAALAVVAAAIVLGLGVPAAQASAAVDLTITAEFPPSPPHLLYPGATGDVVARITNPNAFTVTINAVILPSNPSYAVGYSDLQLTQPRAGCSAATSEVSWNGSTTAGDTNHDLTAPLTIGGGDSLVVTFTDGALMGLGAPAACEGASFRMPSFTGIGAVAAPGDTITGSPVVDGWKIALPPVPPVPPVSPSPNPSGSPSTGGGISGPASAPASAAGPAAPPSVSGPRHIAPSAPLTRPGVEHGAASVPSTTGGGSSGNLVGTQSGGSRPRQWLDFGLRKIARNAKYVAVAGGFTVLLLPFLLIFLALQHLIDKRDPKLAQAPAYADNELPFLPR